MRTPAETGPGDHCTAPVAVAVPARRPASSWLRLWAMVAAHHLQGMLVDRFVDLALEPLDQTETECMGDSVEAGNTWLLAKPTQTIRPLRQRHADGFQRERQCLDRINSRHRLYFTRLAGGREHKGTFPIDWVGGTGQTDPHFQDGFSVGVGECS